MTTLTAEYRHIPVMLDEVLLALNPQAGETVCDCTLGGAGHSKELARSIEPDGLLIGIDQDDSALAAATIALEDVAQQTEKRLLKGNFSQLDELLLSAEVPGVDCFLFDLGVSSHQLDIPQRGFSYNEDAPLDMRMDPGTQTKTAAEVINYYTERDLARIFATYGDERFASQIAHSITLVRGKTPIESTVQLAELVKSAIPAAARRKGGHPARRTFQALRIEVNGELDALTQGLEAAIRWANPGGRIAVISYHSLEDRIVSHLFYEHSRGCTCPPDLPVCVCGNVPVLEVKTKKPLVATDEELARNPRARSALLRVAVKLDV